VRRDVVWLLTLPALGLFASLSGSPAQAADAQVAASAAPPVGPAVTDTAPQVFDRVKAVPKKALLKRHRLELTPEASLSLNDGFYEHFAFGGSAVYYLHDAFGIGISASYLYAHPKTAAVDDVRQTLSAAPLAFDFPNLFGLIDLYWIPLYGKVSLPGGGIAQFDMYASAGAGVTTAFGNHNPIAVSFALGQHYAMSRWAALRLEVRDTLYLDRQASGSTARSSVQSYVMFSAGVSFFVPPTFEYTYK
jgi:outer membrane beta-barrel protein